MNINAHASTNGAWGDWVEVYRYTGSGHLIFSGTINPARNYTTPSGGGDRAGGHFRVRHMNSANVQQRILEEGHTYVRAGQSPYHLFTEHGTFAFSVPVVMASGDYLLVEGRAAVQQAATNKGIVCRQSETEMSVQSLAITLS